MCSGRALPGQRGPAPGRWGTLMGGKMDGLDWCQQAEKLNTGLCTQSGSGPTEIKRRHQSFSKQVWIKSFLFHKVIFNMGQFTGLVFCSLPQAVLLAQLVKCHRERARSCFILLR